jgi:hypothetical protein
VEDVVGETPNTGETGGQDATTDATRAGIAPDAGHESTVSSGGEDRAAHISKPTDSTWADDRTTDLDPGRVGSDEQQTPARRSEGEPDE